MYIYNISENLGRIYINKLLTTSYLTHFCVFFIRKSLDIHKILKILKENSLKIPKKVSNMTLLTTLMYRYDLLFLR